MDDRLGLGEVTQSLREELYEAMKEGAGKLLRFRVGAVDLEFQVELTRERGAGGKIRFWVVEAGGEAKGRSASTQIVKVRLEPIDVITHMSPLIGGDEANRPLLPDSSPPTTSDELSEIEERQSFERDKHEGRE